MSCAHKDPVWALSARSGRPEPQHQPVTPARGITFLRGPETPASCITPLPGNDFPARSTSVPYVKCHSLSHHHETILVFASEPIPQGVRAALGRSVCSHQCAPRLPPSPWPPSMSLLLGAQSTPLPHPEGGHGSMPEPHGSVLGLHLSHPSSPVIRRQ